MLKIILCSVMLMLFGCASTNWRQLSLTDNWRQDGWQQVYELTDQGFSLMIFIGQQQGQKSLMIFGLYDHYYNNWDKVLASWPNDRISDFTFLSKQ